MTTRKPCINVPTATYSGKEQSPLHFGLSAEGYDLNTILEGYDHMMWSVKMKNGRKVWIRNMAAGTLQRMVHEEPVVTKNEEELTEVPETTQVPPNITSAPPTPPVVQEPIVKPIVEEKKITDYNLFLAYRLNELKKEKPSDKTNKELFNQAVAEWKELKKNASELKRIIDLAKHHKN
jgi:hypothetical protein